MIIQNGNAYSYKTSVFSSPSEIASSMLPNSKASLPSRMAYNIINCNILLLPLPDLNARLPLEVNINKFPKTLVVKDGEKFDMSFSMKVRRRLPVKYKIDIDLWKKIAFWVKIPCISGAGSW